LRSPITLLLSLASAPACGSRESAPPPPSHEATPQDWDAAVESVARRRAALQRRWRQAKDATARAQIRDEASRMLVAAIVDELAPHWLGMPWGMGPSSTATRPFAPEQTIACSYFVGALLGAAGFALHDRFALGQAPALEIQRSLVGDPEQVHRFFSIPPQRLAERIAALGDGLWLAGLANHVGFVVVRDGEVRFLHASYTGDAVVMQEPLADSAAIAASQPKGYFISPVVLQRDAADDWVVERWLEGDAVGPTK
jgi:cell wall-associated NlpC family hydrolase